jgi:hypothetical protein
MGAGEDTMCKSKTFHEGFGRAAFGLALVGLSGMVLANPAAALSRFGDSRTVNGVTFYRGDPGPVTDPYWTAGQYKYDPNGNMTVTRWDAGIHLMTVYGDHSGAANCVFRRRVTVDDWDWRHPFVRVCRRPE